MNSIQLRLIHSKQQMHFWHYHLDIEMFREMAVDKIIAAKKEYNLAKNDYLKDKLKAVVAQR
jgi:hypothetical protein